MKVLVLTFILMFPLSSSANCLLRITIDPIFSKNLLTSFEKTAKAKKYKIIDEADERWEHFRLKVAAATEKVSVKLEKFVARNFETAFEEGRDFIASNRDEVALNTLKELPTCPQALYSDIFANLED